MEREGIPDKQTPVEEERRPVRVVTLWEDRRMKERTMGLVH